jgi:hypothetical protein
MREAQKKYFALIARAKKTKAAADYAAAAIALKESKNIELIIDLFIEKNQAF